MDDSFLKKRFADLASRCYKSGVYTFTDFLSLADIAEYYECEKELSYVPATVYGGNEACERKMIRFGSEEMLGYEAQFPIAVLRISPLIDKFSDALSHRDFLGALMNLGVERDKLGDIFVKENKAFVYCEEAMADYICDNLLKVKHTSVKTEIVKDISELPKIVKQEISVNVASERIDVVNAAVYKLSRSESAELFREAKVYLNGRLMENESRKLSPGDIVSVRGHGKYEFTSIGGLSRKGRQYVTISIYV